MAEFGFGKQYATATDRGTLGAAYNRDRISAPLVKAGGDGNSGSGGQQSGGGGGGGSQNCPKCVGWYWIPLGAVGIMQTLAWLLARK